MEKANDFLLSKKHSFQEVVFDPIVQQKYKTKKMYYLKRI